MRRGIIQCSPQRDHGSDNGTVGSFGVHSRPHGLGRNLQLSRYGHQQGKATAARRSGLASVKRNIIIAYMPLEVLLVYRALFQLNLDSGTFPEQHRGLSLGPCSHVEVA